MNSNYTLTDTRPYPADPVKNDLLLYATQIAASSSGAQRKLSEQSLHAAIYNMFEQNHYLGLSVAMSMAPDAPSYQALLNGLDFVLQAKTEEECQWFALPVVIVAGCNQPTTLTSKEPNQELTASLANYPHTRALTQATWLPNLVCAEDLAVIKVGEWFKAKQNAEAAAEFAANLPINALALESGQSVHVLYAVGYGNKNLLETLGNNLQNAALPLMQVWQEAMAKEGVTLFTNPLSANTPLIAIAEASHMRLRMALDAFATNAIRAIRLQSPRVGVVMASQQGGNLMFGFNATDSVFELQPQVFVWPLSPVEHIETVQHNFLDLLAECGVENIRLLHNAIAEGAELPSYAQAKNIDGLNPLFAQPTNA